MTTRERVLAVFSGGCPDRLPNVEFGYWQETLTRWHAEGVPAHLNSDALMEEYLGLEGITVFAEVPVINGLHPRFERTVLRDDGDRILVRDEEGNLCEELVGRSSMPRFVEFGLKTRADWDRLKAEHLDPDAPGRIGDLERFVRSAKESGRPVIINAGSLYGWLRNWMGVEEFSFALMTERGWVEEMMDHLVHLSITLFERVLPSVRVDLAWWWEDMCYNRGPLISPKMFHEIMVPRYREVTACLRRHGIQTNVLDCDGRIIDLVPGWLEGGINCMFPLEAAHTDAYQLRRQMGECLLLLGGVDKLALIAGKDAIDKEIERLIPLVRQGRYIPCVDHRVPADVSFENYRYYLRRKQILLDLRQLR